MIQNRDGTPPPQPETRPPDRRSSAPPTLGDVLFWPLNEIPRLSVGYLNLLCATLLPDTASLKIPACLEKLAQWAKVVGEATDAYMDNFRRNPEKFRNSEAHFRVLVMVTVLQERLGVRYNPDCLKKQVISSGEVFIHGLLDGHPGTCSNMPVLYAAIGRMLHYPIYLCQAKRHVFCRWQSRDGKEKFNIEGSGKGLNIVEDEEYKRWPFPISERELEEGHFLKNLDPIEELGLFMLARAFCLYHRGCNLDAIVAFAHAHRLSPVNPKPFYFLLDSINKEIRSHLNGLLPGGYLDSQNFRQGPGPKLVEYVLDEGFPRLGKGSGDTQQDTWVQLDPKEMRLWDSTQNPGNCST